MRYRCPHCGNNLDQGRRPNPSRLESRQRGEDAAYRYALNQLLHLKEENLRHSEIVRELQEWIIRQIQDLDTSASSIREI